MKKPHVWEEFAEPKVAALQDFTTLAQLTNAQWTDISMHGKEAKNFLKKCWIIIRQYLVVGHYIQCHIFSAIFLVQIDGLQGPGWHQWSLSSHSSWALPAWWPTQSSSTARSHVQKVSPLPKKTRPRQSVPNSECPAKVLRKSWERPEKFFRKSWESPEKDFEKSWENPWFFLYI